MAKYGPQPGSPGARRNAERMRKLHADPEFKAANSERAAERMRKLNADPEFKAATAERMRKLHADPEFKAATAERMRKLHADPEFKARHYPWLASLSAKERADYDVLRKAMPAKEARAAIEQQRKRERVAIPPAAGRLLQGKGRAA